MFGFYRPKQSLFDGTSTLSDVDVMHLVRA